MDGQNEIPARKNHVYRPADIAVIKAEMEGGAGYKAVFKKYVTSRKSGRKPWKLGGVKKVMQKLKKGQEERKKGSGRKKWVRTESLVAKVKGHVLGAGGSANSSIKKIQKKFRLARGTAARILSEECNAKSIRKVKKTSLSEKNRKERIEFRTSYLEAIRKKKIDTSSIFFTDESLFRNAAQVSNKHNDCIRVPKNTIKKNLAPDVIVSSVGNSNLHIMVALGVSKMGVTNPIFVPKGTKINGEAYLEMMEQQYFPQMKMLAKKAGKDGFIFQQDNAPAHRVAPVLASIGKNAKPLFKWPACSPDLSVLDYFVWNDLKQYIEAMDPPPKNEADLRMAVCLAADALDQQKLNSAIDNMAKRCEKCLEFEGKRFEYAM